jgi:ribose transport system ATP-binding protein
MVGRDKKDFFIKQQHEHGDIVFETRGLCLKDAIHPDKYILSNINLQVRAGEVLGIYGLMGAGRTELFETIFGLYPKETSGDIWVSGKKAEISHPEDAVKCGMALIPEDRKTAGLVLDMNVCHNTTLASLSDCLKMGLLDQGKEEKTAEDYRQRLDIKSYSLEQLAGQLSGGNQQKIVLAKWLLTNPKVIFLDEPTRGIDILAKNEIYKHMDELAAQGMALIVVSSELPEIMAVSDRIITLCEGEIGAEFLREQFTEAAILKAALPRE